MAKNTETATATSLMPAREFLVTKGFKPGARGRFSTDMVQALQDAGYPIKAPKERTKVTSIPLA